MTLGRWQLFLSIGRAGRIEDIDADDLEPETGAGTFGRYWWFWLPRFNWSGLPWRDRWTSVSVNWLCFWFGVDIVDQRNSGIQSRPKGTEP